MPRSKLRVDLSAERGAMWSDPASNCRTIHFLSPPTLVEFRRADECLRRPTQHQSPLRIFPESLREKGAPRCPVPSPAHHRLKTSARTVRRVPRVRATPCVQKLRPRELSRPESKLRRNFFRCIPRKILLLPDRFASR